MIFKLFLLSTLVGLASSACFDNGDKEIGGSCYKFVAQKLSFEDARNWCHYKNPVTASYLAYVPNQFTSNFLASYARSAFGTNDGSFWIGLSRKSGGSWSWDAGFPLGYTNFGDQVGQNYVAESIVNAKWNTFGASDTNFFVCGYDPAAPPTFAPQTAGTSGPTPTMRATTQPVPTTTGDHLCTQRSITSFLVAYSNDFDPKFVVSIVEYFTRNGMTGHFSMYAGVRFDVKKEEEFIYDSDWDEFANKIKSHLPDPSLSFDKNSTGSDVIRTIDRFLDTTEVPVCGSRLLVLVKRYPNETDITKIVSKLRLYHSTIQIIASKTPSGGHHPETLYELAAKTNGLCGFETDNDESGYALSDFLSTIYQPFLIYASNPEVSGKGSVKLPTLVIPDVASYGYFLEMTIQDNGPMEVVKNVTLYWSNKDSKNAQDSLWISHPLGNLLYGSRYFDELSYNMSLDYDYLDSSSRRVQIRIYGSDYTTPVDCWPPYDN